MDGTCISFKSIIWTTYKNWLDAFAGRYSWFRMHFYNVDIYVDIYRGGESTVHFRCIGVNVLIVLALICLIEAFKFIHVLLCMYVCSIKWAVQARQHWALFIFVTIVVIVVTLAFSHYIFRSCWLGSRSLYINVLARTFSFTSVKNCFRLLLTLKRCG